MISQSRLPTQPANVSDQLVLSHPDTLDDHQIAAAIISSRMGAIDVCLIVRPP
ncbi:MAG: hypothetical protein ACM36C_12880 [Acidobacteriota bacterium]